MESVLAIKLSQICYNLICLHQQCDELCTSWLYVCKTKCDDMKKM
jgi:hypothetical protein